MEDKKKKESYEMNQALIERLRIAMERAQTNARELAETADVGRSFVYDVLSGKSLNPTTHKLSAVANALGVSMSYLLYGEESWGGGRHADDADKAQDSVAIATIAVEASASGGMVITEAKDNKPFFFRRSWIQEKLRVQPGDLRVLTVRGDSMAPTLTEGDIVLVNLREKAPSPPGIFVLFDGIGLLPKRLEMQPDGDVHVLSDNAQYAPYVRALTEVNIIGRIVWFAREF